MSFFTRLISLAMMLGMPLASTSQAEPQQPAVSVEPPHVLFLGDSITAGGRWFPTAEKIASIKALPGGECGRKTSEGKHALEKYLVKYPDATRLVIFLGVNDLPSRDTRPDDVKVASCVANMSEIIDLGLTRFKPKDIILIAPTTVHPEAMNELNKSKGYDVCGPMLAQLETEYKALAEKKGVQFLSLLNALTGEQTHDGLHPKQPAGNEVLGQAIGAYLASH